MSRTYKIDRARRARLPGKAWRTAYGRSLDESRLNSDRLSKADYTRARAWAEDALEEQGLDPSRVCVGHGNDDDLRTGGVRYGNQRKMRAKMDLAARRADRKRHSDPMLDADGDLGLPNRPESAARRRGPRWTN